MSKNELVDLINDVLNKVKTGKYKDIIFDINNVKMLLEEIKNTEKNEGICTINYLISWVSEDEDFRLVLGFLGNGKRTYYPSNSVIRLGLIKFLKAVGFNIYRFGKVEIVTFDVPEFV